MKTSDVFGGAVIILKWCLHHMLQTPFSIPLGTVHSLLHAPLREYFAHLGE